MDATTRTARARTFGKAALEYDAVRPGYPQELIADLIAFAQMPTPAQALEIGCGTGQATRSLVDLDLQLTCLEPSTSLCRLARSNFASCKNVRFLAESFEAFTCSGAAFHLIFAATSFHWLDPSVRLSKCADLLVSGGTLAVFSNMHPLPYTGFFAGVQEIYDKHVPEWESPLKPKTSSDEKLMEAHPRKKYLANINPANERSIHMFEKLGFKHIQNTYERTDA